MEYNFPLQQFLIQCRTVTENYEEAWGKWSIKEQWIKIREEDKEFEFPKSRDNELEEFWDTFFARLTLLHMKGYMDNQIMDAGTNKLKIIFERSKKKLQEQIDAYKKTLPDE